MGPYRCDLCACGCTDSCHISRMNVEIVCRNTEFRIGATVEIRIEHPSASNNNEILYVEILIP